MAAFDDRCRPDAVVGRNTHGASHPWRAAPHG
ncbi:hypothetical protein STRAU_0241 [Streptomyces aurantiacus JA 4570]|uniref:Uncharacterized protein n=1 Tax=Streptomyces aurantiacus JA 4570 TaxID=1286094 RepID=S3ZU33_9ACTN|nr:hypothetical protein STRAU_0241 [Streptomyces aurantiacus JA 4570]